MLGKLRVLFTKPSYAVLAIAVAITLFLFSVWLPNWNLIQNILFDPTILFGQKLSLLVALASSITTNFTPLTATYVIVVAILSGINIALITYTLRSRAHMSGGVKEYFLSALGLGSGIVGAGCAACGTIVVAALLGSFGGGLLAFLPFGGLELGALGIILLLISSFVFLRKMDEPLVCAPS